MKLEKIYMKCQEINVRTFEIPYNFDKNLIDALTKIKHIQEMCHSIYIPPYCEDYHSVKQYYDTVENGVVKMQRLITRQNYENHIEYIRQHFPNKMMLLLQQNDFVINNELLNYYINLGFTKFCVGSVEQANNIKKIMPRAEIVASITMKLSPQDLEEKQYEVFDAIVLWFPYNRKISVIKTLPKKYRYIILVNCECNVYCEGTHHWFTDEIKLLSLDCPKTRDNSWINTMRIYPWDLSLFEPYVSHFKIQGREYSTEYLLPIIDKYMIQQYPKANLRQEYKYENKNLVL